MNPLQEFLGEYGEKKEANAPSVAGRFRDALVGGAAAAGTAAVIGGAGMAASAAYDALTKSRDFKKMLEYNPDLHEHHQNDPRLFNQMYSSLRQMNPTFARDPLVAGGIMRQMSLNPNGMSGILQSVAPGRPTPSAMHNALDIGSNTGAQYFVERNKQLARQHVLPEDPNADIRSMHERGRMLNDMTSPLGKDYFKKQPSGRRHREEEYEDEYGQG